MQNPMGIIMLVPEKRHCHSKVVQKKKKFLRSLEADTPEMKSCPTTYRL